MAASTSLRAIELLGALLSTDGAVGLPAQTVTERLKELCNRAGVPGELRDIADNWTALLPVVQVGNRLDWARGAASSSVGGTLGHRGEDPPLPLWLFLVALGQPADYFIGTKPGYVCPSPS